MFDLTQMYNMPLDQLMSLDPTLLEKPLQMMQGGQQGMPPVQQGPVPGFDAMINPQGTVSLSPGVGALPPPVIQAPIEEVNPANLKKKPDPSLTAQQLFDLQKKMEPPDQPNVNPGSPASGRNIGQMQRLGAAPPQQQMPMTLAQLLSGRR